WYTIVGRVPNDTPRPPLAEGEVRFVGDPVAMIVAEDRYLAEDAADLVLVDYEMLPPVVDFEQAEDLDELVHESHRSNLICSLSGSTRAAVEEVLASSANIVTETIYQQAQSPCPMECRGIIAHHQSATGAITVYAATQAPHEVRAFCARLLGIPEHRIR